MPVPTDKEKLSWLKPEPLSVLFGVRPLE